MACAGLKKYESHIKKKNLKNDTLRMLNLAF